MLFSEGKYNSNYKSSSYFVFSGNFCEVEPSLCEILEWPCENGGTCYASDDINILKLNDNGQGYNCFCPSGYTGLNCEEGMNLTDFYKTT